MIMSIISVATSLYTIKKVSRPISASLAHYRDTTKVLCSSPGELLKYLQIAVTFGRARLRLLCDADVFVCVCVFVHGFSVV